jgi:hypothetical protein
MKGGFLSLAVVLALAGTASADVKPGERKGAEEQPPEPKKNPLPPIIEQMKDAERRIAESETGRWTQEEQQRIVDALKLEGSAVEALEKLIKEIESRPP